MARKIWGGRWGSNPRPPESQSGALPTELRPPLFRVRILPCLKPLVRPTYGAPGRTRTCNPRLRRPVLYPVELRALCGLVGVERFELPTHCSQSSCATRLRYTPTRCTAGHYRGIWGGTSMPVLSLSRLTIIFAKRIMRCLICARSSAG